jgi:hypothetical protein
VLPDAADALKVVVPAATIVAGAVAVVGELGSVEAVPNRQGLALRVEALELTR